MDAIVIALVALLAVSALIHHLDRKDWTQTLLQLDKDYLAHIAEMEREHQKERRELANRIQHPNHMPIPARPRPREKANDEQPTQRVGTILAPRDPAA